MNVVASGTLKSVAFFEDGSVAEYGVTLQECEPIDIIDFLNDAQDSDISPAIVQGDSFDKLLTLADGQVMAVRFDIDAD